MSDKLFIKNFVPGQEIREILYVEEKSSRTSSNGKPYLDLKLRDRTGSVSAKKWDWNDNDGPGFSKGNFLFVKGIVENYKDQIQLKIHSIEVTNAMYVEMNDFVDSEDPVNIEKYYEMLLMIIDKVKNPYIKNLLDSFYRDNNFIVEFIKWPGAKEVHHNKVGGLLKHTVYMLRIALFLAERIYKDVNIDLLLAGVALHDIGKMEELGIGVSINYTVKGELIGHAVLGLRMIREKIAQIPDFPEETAVLIDHMMLSHHGNYDFGALMLPKFREAMLVHLIDLLDSKMDIMKKSLEKIGDGEIWTDKCWALDNKRLLDINRINDASL